VINMDDKERDFSNEFNDRWNKPAWKEYPEGVEPNPEWIRDLLDAYKQNKMKKDAYKKRWKCFIETAIEDPRTLNEWATFIDECSEMFPVGE